MEGLVLATDYTLSSYCDILRTHELTDPLSIGVLRFATSEFLEGQLNGRTLEVSFSFDNALGSQVAPGTGDPSATYSSYVTVTDDLGALQVDIPAEWKDVEGTPWIDNGDTIGAALAAAPELDEFWDSWVGSGMYFYVSDAFDRLGGYVELLDHYRVGYEEDCVDAGRYEFQDLAYKGEYDVFEKCGRENGPMLLILSAVPVDDPQAFIVFIGVQVTKKADLDAVDHVLRTFQVVGPLP
jgi:serine protease Do